MHGAQSLTVRQISGPRPWRRGRSACRTQPLSDVRAPLGNDGELGGGGDVRPTGDIAPSLRDPQPTVGELTLEHCRREALQPVEDAADPVPLDDGVLVEQQTLALVLERAQEAEVRLRRPEAVQEVRGVGGRLRPCLEHRPRVHVQQDLPVRGEEGVELPQKQGALPGAEGTEVAHDHDDEVEPAVAVEAEVVGLHVLDPQPLPCGLAAGVAQRALGEVDAGHRHTLPRQTLRVEARAAAEVGDRRSRSEAEVRADPVHRAVDEPRRARGGVDVRVEVQGQHLARRVGVGPQLAGGVLRERLGATIDLEKELEQRSPPDCLRRPDTRGGFCLAGKSTFRRPHDTLAGRARGQDSAHSAASFLAVFTFRVVMRA